MNILTKHDVDEFELDQFNSFRDGLLIAVNNQYDNMKNAYYPPTQLQFKALIPALQDCLSKEENRKEVVGLLLNRTKLATMKDLWRAEMSALIDNIVDMETYTVYTDARMAIRTAEKIVDQSEGVIDQIISLIRGIKL